MGVFWLAQAPSPWWEVVRMGFWSWQPVVVFSLNFISIGIAVAAFIRAGRTDKRSQMRARIFARIAAVRSDSEKISVMVEANLLGRNDNAPLAHSHLPIAAAFRQLEIKVRELEVALPWRKAEIFRAFNTWKSAATADGYPVQRKANAFKPGDSRVAQVAVAQTQMSSSLSEIEDECIRETVPFWKKWKGKPVAPALQP